MHNAVYPLKLRSGFLCFSFPRRVRSLFGLFASPIIPIRTPDRLGSDFSSNSDLDLVAIAIAGTAPTTHRGIRWLAEIRLAFTQSTFLIRVPDALFSDSLKSLSRPHYAPTFAPGDAGGGA